MWINEKTNLRYIPVYLAIHKFTNPMQIYPFTSKVRKKIIYYDYT